LAQFSHFEDPATYHVLARRPYAELVEVSNRIARALANALDQDIGPQEILVDAPPQELEVDFDIEVHFPKQSRYQRLGDISPVVRTLAQEQFDDYVKRVRIFVHPRRAEKARALPNLAECLHGAIAG
jgi:hypothetical protein